MYTGMTSWVRYQGKLSRWFSVRQGTRQGGRSSPILYLLYINELINTLEGSEYGLCMYNVKLTSPTVADDMMLVALSYTGINAMLDICNSYSKKWRYEYNASKCSVVVFNELAQHKETRCFKLGDNTINETRDDTHLGIVCDSF